MRIIDANSLLEAYWEEQKKPGIYSMEKLIIDAPIIDPESLRPKAHWDIRCDYHVDTVTREVDESFYLECSECKRKVWDINQMAAMNGEYWNLIEQYPYCHCGCKMEE